jgi:ribosomal protein L12E/L44/L45/RPP1/RPP2
MTALTPMFEKYNVTAGFFGHDHNYQHYLKNGVHYIISGGGGAPLYDVDKPPVDITQKVASIENFVSVSVDGPRAHVQAISMEGKVLDEFDFRGSAQPKPAPSASVTSAVKAPKASGKSSKAIDPDEN